MKTVSAFSKLCKMYNFAWKLDVVELMDFLMDTFSIFS